MDLFIDLKFCIILVLVVITADDEDEDEEDDDAFVSTSSFGCLEILSSHSFPLKPSGQAQKYSSPTSKQVPPFLQGKSQSLSQRIIKNNQNFNKLFSNYIWGS